MECNVTNCDRTDVRSSGYCTKHHANWRRNGTPLSKWERMAAEPRPQCSVDGCDRDAVAKGYCNRHYENVRLRGTAIPLREMPLRERLKAIGWDVTPEGCWEWRGGRNEYGYGIAQWGKEEAGEVRVHRIMYRLHNGDFPDELHVRHKCDNPPCSNPDHLEVGTHADNMRDMSERGRDGNDTRRRGGFCPNGHDLRVPGSTKTVKRSGRKPSTECIACARERSRRYGAKARSAKHG